MYVCSVSIRVCVCGACSRYGLSCLFSFHSLYKDTCAQTAHTHAHTRTLIHIDTGLDCSLPSNIAEMSLLTPMANPYQESSSFRGDWGGHI